MSSMKSFCSKRFVSFSSKFGSRSSTKEQYDFGFSKVESSEEKQEMVNEVFKNVANKYDVMNDVMSVGMHRIWKNYLVSSVIRPQTSSRILDMAGGTGDIAIGLSEYMRKRQRGDEELGEIVVGDINENMLDEGRKKVEKKAINNIQFQLVNGEFLENFEDNQFDFYSICFGIRNCSNISNVLSEAFRVLKPGGAFFCMEFTPEVSASILTPVVQKLYDIYSFQLIPVFGQLIASDYDSYQYLVESIRQFPNTANFSKMISDAGFQNVSVRKLVPFGVVNIHCGMK
ncbi:hypothetical protein SNEBB_010159 [Seison nebaliae]|nr:hypothetical protein SNEBB_010159 [Seison nebaliae]